MSVESNSVLLAIACLALQEAAPTAETAERTRQALEFRTRQAPDSLDPAAGTLTVEYGKRNFTEEQALAVLELPAGARLSPSAGFPATLDVDVPLVFGKTRLEPGLYFVCIERPETGWQLVFVTLESALQAGWTGGEEIRAAGTVVAAQASERRDGGEPEHQLWTGPNEHERGLAFFVQYGRLALSAEVQPKAKKGKPAAWEERRWRSSLRAADGALLASVEHGRLAWSSDAEGVLGRLKSGKRWALGKDHWTSLIVLAPLELGGVAVPAGDYALVLERGKGEAGWALALIDSKARRKAFTNPQHADELAAAARVPLAHEEPAIAADELDGRFVEAPARLQFHFGPHRWSVPAARGR